MKNPKICQIVPTKDRPELLRRLLVSVQSQKGYLQQIIVVDGGDCSVEDVCKEFAALPITYNRVQPPGLARQRNAGLDLVRKDIDLVGFWDDDIVLEPGCMEAMCKFWAEGAEDVGGAEYNIVAGGGPRPPCGKAKAMLDRIFLMEGPQVPGILLRSGESTGAFPARETHEVQWLCGGANLYRREIFERFEFDEWFDGYGIGDDVDFSYRVSGEYKMYVVAEATVQHLMVPVAAGNDFIAGRVVATNQLYFVQKNKNDFSRLLAAWCIFGKGIRHIIGGSRLLRKRDILRGLGYLSAIPAFCLGRLRPIKRQVK